MSEGAALRKRHLQSTGPQLRTYLQNTLCKSRCRLLVLRCSTGNHLAEVLSLLPEHQSSGNCRFTCIRFTNAGHLQRISRQNRVHLVQLVTEHRQDQVLCHGIRAKADSTVTVGPQQCGTHQLRYPAPAEMLIPPLGKARKDVIHLAGIGHKQAERGSDAAQVDEADIPQLRERPPAIELEAQHAIIQGVSGVWIGGSRASRTPLYRTLRLRVLHPAVVNDREPCLQHNIERRVPRMLGNRHFWRIDSVDDLTEPPYCLTVEQYRVRSGFQLLHQPLSQLNAIRLQVLTKILPPGVDASSGQHDPGGRTPPAQGSQQSRKLLLPGLLRVVDHDKKLSGELRKICQIVIPHRALGRRKTRVPAKDLQIVTQLRRHTGLTHPSRTGQHGDRDIGLPPGTLGSSHRPFPELPILRTRAERHHTVTGLDHLQRRTVIRQRQVTRRQHLLSTRQGGEL